MTDDLLPIPANWTLADHDRDRHHPLVQAAAAVANMTRAPVRAYTSDHMDTTRVALVVDLANIEHTSGGVVMAEPAYLTAMAPMFAGPLRQIAAELVAVAAALNSEANRLDPWSNTVTLGSRTGEDR